MSANAVMSLINSLFFILGGITVFMIGMEMMGSNIEKAAGKSMRSLMEKATVNRFAGVGTGAVITAIVNSSGATTVMIVGFVNVGLMTLTQATSVIMGANIGTTISAFIMALASEGGAELNIAAIFAFIAAIGWAFTLFGKSDALKQVGRILEGIGMIFIGLNVISGAVATLTAEGAETAEAIKAMFVAIGGGKEVLTWEIPVLFVLGAALTALVHSSAAITAIVITLAGQGQISLPMAMFITLGANVGTCVTSLISAISGNTNAKRTAMIHFLFNLIGSVVFIIPLSFFGKPIADLFGLLPFETKWQIAVFHLFFNLITTAVLLPFQSQLVKLACALIPEKVGEQEEKIETLDRRLLQTPSIAVGETRKEITRMSGLAFANYKRSLDMLLSGDMSSLAKFNETEDEINKLNSYIASFLVKLSAGEVSARDEYKIGTFYHVISDIERIGDYATNITEYAQGMADDKIKFSEHAVEEIRAMDMHITKLYEYVIHTFSKRDLRYAEEIEMEEQATDEIKEQMKAMHILRITEGNCDAKTGAFFLQLAADMERIGDHLHNISNSVKEYM